MRKLALVLVAAALVAWGLDALPARQPPESPRLILWTVGPLRPEQHRRSLPRLALARAGAPPVIEGGADGLGPVLLPDGEAVELELAEEHPEMDAPPEVRSVARVPLRTGDVRLGDRAVAVVGEPLVLTGADAEPLRRRLDDPSLAAAVAAASWSEAGVTRNARVWQVRVYPTTRTTYAEVFVAWELTEKGRAMAAGEGPFGVRLFVQEGQEGLRVLPSHGSLREIPGGPSGVSGWASLHDSARAQVDAFLRREGGT